MPRQVNNAMAKTCTSTSVIRLQLAPTSISHAPWPADEAALALHCPHRGLPAPAGHCMLPFYLGVYFAIIGVLLAAMSSFMMQVLCSVKRPGQALREMRRVLKDRGRLLFIEHVLAPPDKPGLRLAQRLLDPLQQFASDGCHLVRDTLPLVRFLQ